MKSFLESHLEKRHQVDILYRMCLCFQSHLGHHKLQVILTDKKEMNHVSWLYGAKMICKNEQTQVWITARFFW